MNDATDIIDSILAGLVVDETGGIPATTEYTGKYIPIDTATAKKVINAFLGKLPVKIGIGSRWKTSRSYAGILWACGYSEGDIKTKLVQFDHERNDPPKNDMVPIDNILKFISRCPRGFRERKKKPRAPRKSNDEIPEYNLQPRGWFERGGNLFLEVIDTTGDFTEYSYAVMKNGRITFIDEITVKEPITNDDGTIFSSGLKYVPRSLPENKDGQPILMVGIPEKRLLESITHSDIGQIKTDMISHIGKYCELPPNDLDLCVYYILTTWFYATLSTVPYLRFRADTGKGKSRILKVISDLCFYPVKAGGASTASGTIRFAEYWHGTIVIDEADIKGEADDSGGYTNDMIKYLNLGFERGQYFIKSDKTDPKRQEVFDPFCPKVIAMRGVFQDPATEGRCLSISPSETERADIPAILPAEYDRAAGKIRAALAHYTLYHWGIVSDADPYPSFNDVECEHRLKQLGGPLAKVLSKVFPDGLEMFKHYIELRQVEVKADRAASFVGSVVNLAYDKALEQERVYPSQIADDLNTKTARISRTLKDAGIGIEQARITESVKRPDGTTSSKTTVRKVVAVKDARTWREVCRRYIIAKKEQAELSPNDMVDCPRSIQSATFTPT